MSFELRGLAGLTDKARMDELINFIKIQIDDESDPLALMGNVSAFIYAGIKDLNWAGFYFLKEDELVLGPFQGLPACTRLSLDKGVCAASFTREEIVKVDDVHDFPGHIACDSASVSELVIPLFHEGKCYGVLDLDSPHANRFTNVEVDGFKRIAELIQDKIHLNF